LANYSHRIANGESLVLLGENQEYEPLSRAAFHKAIQKEKKRNDR